MANSKRKCKWCKEYTSEFITVPGGTFCGIDHAIEYSREQVRKQAERERKKVQRAHKEAKKALRPRSWYVKEAQKWFNKYIRLRDEREPCICCGEWAPDEGWKPGGQWDAGHYLSVGSHPELRFDEANCHKQLKSCNAGEGRFARKRRTVSEEYRIRLIDKIGEPEVLRLEGPHEPKKYTIDYLKAIIATYKAKARELEKQLAA